MCAQLITFLFHFLSFMHGKNRMASTFRGETVEASPNKKPGNTRAVALKGMPTPELTVSHLCMGISLLAYYNFNCVSN